MSPLSEQYPRDENTFIRTYTGRKYWPLNPHPEDVCIEDIAHHLALINRFAGATYEPYSVAQHSILVSKCIKDRLAPFIGADRLRLLCLAGLLHDASEAYLQDIPRPFKHSPVMDLYREWEEKNERAIAEALGVEYPWPTCVKSADIVLLRTEMRDLLGKKTEVYATWRLEDRPADLLSTIFPLEWRDAETKFLHLYRELQ